MNRTLRCFAPVLISLLTVASAAARSGELIHRVHHPVSIKRVAAPDALRMADDKGTHAEPGDDKGTHAEPGDDNGGQGNHHEPGDAHGGQRGR